MMTKKYGVVSNPHSPKWANAEKTAVLFTVTIDGYDGEHSFGATSWDGEAHGRELYQDAVDGVFGEVADYVAPTTEKTAFGVRAQRNILLSNTDWTQMPDVPQATKDLWQPYRQALRDVPQQAGFPDNIVWPTPPQ